MSTLAGIVLCGGQSSRMGRSKAWLPLGEEIMLPWIVRQVAAVASPVVVVAAPGQDLPPLPAEVLVSRDETPAQGPLEGIAAGLAAVRDKAEAAYVSSCDVPLLKPAFIRRVAELLEQHEICVPYVGGRHHPLAAVYRVEVLAKVKALLEQKRMRPFFLFGQCDTRMVTEEELRDADPDMHSLRNVNTSEDYQRALIDWQSQQSKQ